MTYPENAQMRAIDAINFEDPAIEPAIQGDFHCSHPPWKW